MSEISSTRLHGLDAVRGAALLLGVFFHAAFSFFPGDQLWLIMDTSRSEVISGGAYVLHMFRMTIFFLLAGYFARMQTHRLGTGRFALDRLKRIGAPLVIFWPILMICFIALAIWGLSTMNGGEIPADTPPAPPLTLATFPLTHLWFLYALILLYVAALLLRVLLSMTFIREPLGRIAGAIVGILSKTSLLPIVMAAPIAFAFLQIENWHPFFGIPTPEYGFVPNITSVVAYGGAFGLGWILQRDETLLKAATRLWPVYLIVAIGLSAWCLMTVGTTVKYFMPLDPAVKPYYAGAYALAIWCWTLGLTGLSMKIFSGESKVRRYIADSSYWIYIIHLPVVMAGQVLLSQWDMPAGVKFAILLGVTMPLLIGSYHLLVRYSFIGGLLNGKKRSRQAT